MSEDPNKFPILRSDVLYLKRFALDNSKDWSCFNPSIGYSPKKGYAIIFRSSNYVILPHGELHVTNNGEIKNQIWFSEIDKNFKLKNFRQIDVPDGLTLVKSRIEDSRLFWRDNAWHFAAVMTNTHTPVARFCICKLDAKVTKVVSIEVFKGLHHNKPERNWLVPDINPSEHFDFVYGPTAIVKKSKVIYTMTDNERVTGLRGNSHLVEQPDGTYLAVMHKLWVTKSQGYSNNNSGMIDSSLKNYAHYFVRFDRFGSIVELSDAFQFISSGIEFVGGMVEMNDNLVISLGKNDVSSHISVVKKALAIEMLRPVGQ